MIGLIHYATATSRVDAEDYFVKRMRVVSEIGDSESRHSNADGLVDDALRALGYHKLADAYFDALDGCWYA